MAKLIACRGLPGSGKSSWAKEQVLKSGGSQIIVNRDDLRASVHGGGKWSKAKERIITVMRDAMIHEGLTSGLTVINDDTNLSPKVMEHLKTLARANGAEFAVQDFTDVTPGGCIKRDLTRDRSVGAEVIMRMFNDHLKPDVTVTVDENLPMCVIFDMDGTLALHVSRGPFEYEKCSEDAPNPMVVGLAKRFKTDYEIVVCSGREGTDQCRADTLKWIADNGIPMTAFFMRSEGDMRKDAIIKREILERDILPRWNPVLVVDDRQQVVDMYRDAGLKCWQVAPGNF